MTEQKKRRRNRNRPAVGSIEVAAAASPAMKAIPQSIDPTMPMPDWKWKTFPVYFALAAGLMVGVYGGWLAGFIAADRGNETPTTIVFIVAALLFGFGLSRFTTRWMLSRRWIKPRKSKTR